MKIPLRKPTFKKEINENIIRYLNKKNILDDEIIVQFESNYAEYIGVKYAIAVNSGTTAIILALTSLEIKKDDFVITSPATFISTSNAIKLAGGKLLFLDISNNDYSISLKELNKMLKRRKGKVKAILPIHLYGWPCDMDNIIKVAKKNNLFVIEDACQAHGARYQERKVGSIGDIGIFSFNPLKIMTVFGDGGMITTNNREIADRCRELRDWGRSKKDPYKYNHICFTSKMNALNAIIGINQLKYLDGWNYNRNIVAEKYSRALDNIGDIVLPPLSDYKRKRVWYLFSIRTRYRDSLRMYLENKGIECGMYYKIPVHLQPPYLKLGLEENMFPNAEKLSNEVLNLPIYPDIPEKEIAYVIDCVKEFFDQY